MGNRSDRASRVRRALVLMSLSAAAFLLVIPLSAARSAGAAVSTGASSAAAAGGSPVTVKGPKMWDPAHKQPFAAQSTVTVSQTADLVAQMVHVTWTAFTPSSQPQYDAQASRYSVMVAECKGTNPTQWGDCYMAGQGAQPDIQGPYGPSNEAYATTAKDGTGQADIAVETKAMNSMLDCSNTSPCSLVIVPGQGGNSLTSPPTCTNHGSDSTLAIPDYTFSSTYGTCSWNDRIIIPLNFSPAATGCQLANPAFTVDGSPPLARAMEQWLTGLCAGSNGLGVLYDAEIGEPQSVGDVYNGLADVALTTRPASADRADGVNPTGTKTYAYAPVAITAATVAYWMDNPATGQPYSGVKLDQRLLTKLLTTSYNFAGDGCLPAGNHAEGLGCDKGVNNNPNSLYDDPEFKQLNPGIKPPAGSGGQFQVPTVQAGNYDLTWTVTRWIGADPTAAAFIKGTADPWKGHINTYYQGMTYPTDSFLSQDPYLLIQHQYSPTYPPEKVAQYQSENWDPGTQWQKDPVTGNYPANAPEAPGGRSLIAILGEGDAAAYDFPAMAIPNAAGKYVTPTDASMTAAAQHMVSAGSGTQQVDLANTDPSAYPLTMVVYAMVPTSGVSHSKAAAIARFLDFVAGGGQTPGVAPGQLPAGYVPLPSNLRAQTQQIATEVAKQSGAKPGGGNGGTTAPAGTGGLPSGSPGTTPSLAGATGTQGAKTSLAQAQTPAPAQSPGGPTITTQAVAHPMSATMTKFAVPALLVLGGGAALAGCIALGSSGDTRRLRRAAARFPRRARPGWNRGLGRKA